MDTHTLTPDQIAKRHLCIRALKLCAQSVVCAAEGDLGMAKLYGLEFDRTIAILKGEYPKEG